jgi:hypothetical protein
MRRIFFLQLLILFNFIEGKSIAWGQSEQHYVVWESGPNTVGGTHVPNPGCVNGVSTDYTEITGMTDTYIALQNNDLIFGGKRGINSRTSFVCQRLNENNGVNYNGILFGGNSGTNLHMSGLVPNDSDNGYYFCGYFSQTMKFGNGCNFIQKTLIGNIDLCVVKMDDNDFPEQVVSIGGAGANVIPARMEKDLNGNLYIIGNSGGTVDFDPGLGVTELTAGNFLLKLDANLNFIYVKKLNIDCVSSRSDMTIDQNGNLYITGIFSGSVDIDPNANSQTILTSNGPNDGVILKLNSNGNLIWARQFGIIDDNNEDIQLLTPRVSVHQNSVIMSGYFYKNMHVNVNTPNPQVISASLNNANVFMHKLDTDGNQIWLKHIFSSTPNILANFRIMEIDQDDHNNIYVQLRNSGSFTFDNLTLSNADNSHKATIVSFSSSNGQAQWFKSFGDVNLAAWEGGMRINKSTKEIYFAYWSSGTWGAVEKILKLAPCSLSNPTASITADGTTTFCEGSSVVLNANTGIGLSYQWQNNGTNILGATEASYTANATGSYTVIVTNSGGCSATSTPMSVTVNTNQANITADGETMFCEGSSVVLNANTGTGLSYQWRNNGSDISGATAASYIANTSGSYSVVVSNSNGCSAISTATSVTVNTNPTASITASGATTICEGTSVVLNANTGTGLSYQWQNNGINISGATEATYNAISTGSYTVEVINSNDCSAISTATSVTVNTNPTASITVGGATTFCEDSFVVLNANTETDVSYQWQNNGTNISDATESSYTANTSGLYSFVVTSSNGCSATSTATLVTVNSNPIASITAGGATTFCEGSSVVLNANTGIGLTYQWQNTETNISGATAESYTANTSGSYTVIVTNSNECSATSTITPVTVNANPNATITAAGATTFCHGGSVELNANSGSGLMYQWQNNSDQIPGENALTYQANTAGSYNVIVTNSSGCSASSGLIDITVIDIPSVNAGLDQQVCAGGSVQLNAITSGPSISQVNLFSGNSVTINSSGNANPYPSSIDVNGLIGSITNIRVLLYDLNHTWPRDIDMVLYGPTGSHSIIFTDAIGGSTGSPNGISGRNYTFQIGAPVLPATGFPASGTYGVVNYDSFNGIDTPSAVNSADLNNFIGTNPNGTWSLYIFDDTDADSGFLGSWAIEITSDEPGLITYTWSPSSGLSDVEIQNPEANPTSTTTYEVTITDLNGCSNSDEVTIQVNQLPQVNAGQDVTVCAGTPVTLSGTGASTYSWNNNVQNGVAFVPTTTTTYTLTGTDGATGCTNTDEVLVTVNDLPVVTLNLSTPICDTLQPFTLNGGLPLGGQYAGPSVAGNTFNPSIGPGQYTIQYTYTDINGCSNNAGQTIMVVDCNTASISGYSKTDIRVFPNPTSTYVTIEVPAHVVGKKIALHDLNGKLILETVLVSTNQTIDMEGYAKGSYYLKIENETFNLIKQ